MTATTPQTRAEHTAYEETSRYDEVRMFIDALARQTPRVRVEVFGTSEEGRDLPLIVVGDPPSLAPAARSSRQPVVLVMANIHAGRGRGQGSRAAPGRRLTLGDLLQKAGMKIVDGQQIMLEAREVKSPTKSRC